MNVEIQLAAGARGWLTDERAECATLGGPVLVVEGEESIALGPGKYAGDLIVTDPDPETQAWLDGIPKTGIVGWRIAIRPGKYNDDGSRVEEGDRDYAIVEIAGKVVEAEIVVDGYHFGFSGRGFWYVFSDIEGYRITPGRALKQGIIAITEGEG